MRTRFAHRTLGVFAALALASCFGDATGPGELRMGRFAIAPSFDVRAIRLVDVDRVRIRLARSGGATALDTVVPFPAGDTILQVPLQVPVAGAQETFDLFLRLISDPTGDTVFASGPDPVTAVTGGAAPQPVEPALLYTGTGANAVGVRFVQAPASVFFQDSVLFTAEAVDANNAAIPGTPILFSSSDTTRARVPVDSVGRVVARTTRGSVTVRAELLRTSASTPPLSVTSPLVVQPVPSSVQVQSGDAQSGPVGAALPLPIVARVRAADNLGVQGVVVTFAVTAGGGTLSATVDTTDVSGDASVLWTLGAALGGQTITATAAGITGGTVTATATGLVGAPRQLAFTVQPTSVAAAQPIAPPVVVTVQDTFGNTVTGFAGNVTVALGANPGGATLGGTTTVAAVAGVATFGTLTLNVPGTGYTLTASGTGLIGATSAPFGVSPGAPAQLAFSVQPPSAVVSASSFTVAVEARDAAGNLAPTFTGPVTLGIGTNPAGGTLTGNTTVNAVAGVATFTSIAIDNLGAGYTLTASATGLTTATSSAFDVTASATGNSWINTLGGSWSVAANWSKGTVPGAADTVFIKQAGTYTVVMDQNVSVARIEVGGISGTQTLQVSANTLTLNGANVMNSQGRLLLSGTGTVAGAGSFDIVGSLDWTGGSFSSGGGTTRVLSGGSLTISGNSPRTLSGFTVELGGTGTWSGIHSISSGSGGTLRVLNGGALTITGQPAFQFNQGGAPSLLQVQSGGNLVHNSPGVSTISAGLDNDGQVSLVAGTLDMGGGTGGSADGAWTGAAGTNLSFSTGTYTLGAAGSVGSVGTVTVSGAAVNAAGAWAVPGTARVTFGTLNYDAASGSVGLLQLSGGTLGGSGTLAVTGTFDWQGGSLSGGGGLLLVGAGATMSATGPGSGQALNGYTLELAGTGTWATTTGTLSSGSGGTLRVVAGGQLDVTGDFGIAFNQGGAQSRVVVYGTLRRTTSANPVQFTTAVDDSGTVAVQTGTLQLDNNGTSSGAYTVAAGATLQFGGGTHNLSAASTIGGAGTVQVPAGTVNIGGGYALTGNTQVSGGAFNYNGAGTGNTTTLNHGAGSIGGSSLLQVTTTLNWTGGAFQSGGGTTRALSGSSTTISGTAGRTLNGHTLEIGGAGSWNGTHTVNSGSAGTLRVLSTGVLDISADPTFSFNQGGATSLIENQGTINRTTSTGTVDFSAPFNNNGAVSVSSGTLSLNSGGNLSGVTSVTSPGTLSYSGGTFTLFNGQNVTGTGTAQLNGATLSGLAAGDTARFTNLTLNLGSLNPGAGGVVRVSGLLDWAGNASLGGGGKTLVAAGGTLTLTGTSARALNNHTLQNAGTATWGTTFVINSGSGAVIRNAPGGVFTISGDGTYTWNQGGAVSSFDNQGTLNRTTSTGTAALLVFMQQSGTVSITSGTLRLTNGGTYSAPMGVTAPGALAFDGGTHTFANLAGATGTGTVSLLSGTLATASATDTARFVTLVLTGGNLGQTGVVRVSGTLDWSGTTALDGAGGKALVPAGAALNLTGTGARILSNHTLENGGTATWSTNFTINSGSGAIIRNLPGATFTLSGDGAYAFNLGGTQSVFDNQGTFQRTTSTGAAIWSAFYQDTVGGATLSTGTLRLAGGGRLGGTKTVAAGATLEASAGTMTFRPATSITGAGRLLGSGATLTPDSATAVAPATNALTITNLDLTGGVLTHEGLVTINGAFNWSGGDISSNTAGLGGITSMSSPGVLTISTAATRTLSGVHTLQVGGGSAATWTGTSAMNVGQGSVVRVQAGGLFDWQGDAIMDHNQGGTATFDLQATGTLRRSVSAGVATLEPVINKLGIIDVQTGTLRMSGGSVTNFAGTYTGAGTVDLGGGTFTMTGNFTVPGNLTVSAGSLAFGGGQDLIVAGDFQTTGTGTISMSANGDSVDVGGNATFAGGSTSGLLTGGGFIVRGNLTQVGAGASYAPTNAHRTRFLGSNSQTVTFANTTNSFLRQWYISKTGGNVVLASNLRASYVGVRSPMAITGPTARLITDTVWGNGTGSNLTPLVLEVSRALNDSGGVSPDTLVFNGTGTSQTLNANGNPAGCVGCAAYAFKSFRADNPANVQLGAVGLNFANDLVVSDGRLLMGGTRASVSGNFRTEATGGLQASVAAETLTVAGNVTFAGASTSGFLTGGGISVAGDFTQAGNSAAFAPSGTYRVKLTGNSVQNLSFASPTTSFFQALDVPSTSTRNIVLQTNVLVNGGLLVAGGAAPTDIVGAGTSQRLRVNGVLSATVATASPLIRPPVLELASFPSVDSSFSATRGINPDTMVFVGSLTTFPTSSGIRYKSVRVSTTGTLNFNNTGGNYPDTLLGDLTISGTGARLNLQGTSFGQPLFVTGNFRTENSGALQMTTSFVTLQVNGSATFGGSTAPGLLTAGTLRLLGNFTQTGSSTFQAGSGHTTAFAGSGTQTVTFASPGTGGTQSTFGNLFIGRAVAGSSAPTGIALGSNVFAAGTLQDTSTSAVDSIAGAGFTVTAVNLQVGSNFVFNNAQLVLNSPTAVTVFAAPGLTFRNMNPTATQFTMNLPAGGGLSLQGLNFATAPTTGLYLNFNAPSARTVSVLNSSTPFASFTAANTSHTNVTVTWPPAGLPLP